MRLFLVVLFTVTFSVSVQADTPQGSAFGAPPASLLQRVLQEDERNRTARPIGQCVYSCGDRLIELERCPSGECPEFECRTRGTVCPTRE